MAGQAGFACNGVEVGGGSFQDNIAGFHVEQLVDNLEIGNIQINHIIMGVAVFGNNLGHLPQEGTLGHEACHLVNVHEMLHFVDAAILLSLFQMPMAVFLICQHIVYPAAYQGTAVGTGYIVCGTMVHSQDLALHIRRIQGNNHRNISVFSPMYGTKQPALRGEGAAKV